MTNEQIDEDVATRVMRWKVGPIPKENVLYGYSHYSKTPGYHSEDGWFPQEEWTPTENRNQAFMVMEKLRGSFDLHLTCESTAVENPRWQAGVTPIHNGEGHYGPYAPTMELAICLLALEIYP